MNFIKILTILKKKLTLIKNDLHSNFKPLIFVSTKQTEAHGL